MHLQPNLAAVKDYRHVRRNNGINAGRLGRIQGLVSRSNILSVKDDIKRHVRLYTGLTADADNLRKVFRSKIICGMRAHVKPADAEVNAVRTPLYSSLQALEVACRSHYFKFFMIHQNSILRAPPACRRNGEASRSARP